VTVGSAEIFPPSVGCSERKDANYDGRQRIDGEELVQMRPCRLHYGAVRLREVVKSCWRWKETVVGRKSSLSSDYR
jgi:hypothetical protein